MPQAPILKDRRPPFSGERTCSISFFALACLGGILIFFARAALSLKPTKVNATSTAEMALTRRGLA